MRKFCRLIGNEWKKQFRKKAGWIMLILLAVIAAGYGILMSSSTVIEDDYWWTLEDDCEQMINEYEQFVNEVDYEGNPTDYALHARWNVEYYQTLLDIGATWEDWRYTTGVVSDMVDAKMDGNTATYEKLRSIVYNKDVKAYFESEKAKNQTLYADDAEMLEILNWMTDYCLANEVEPSNIDWRYEKAQEATTNRLTVLEQERLKKEDSNSFNEQTYDEARNAAAIAMYQLENDQAVNPADSFSSSYGSDKSAFWNAMASSNTLMTLVGLFVIVIAGSIVANEFSQGTIKFLLIAPVKRWKLLMSKYVTVLLIGLLMVGILFVGSFGGSLIMGGTSDLFLPALTAENGEVITSSPYVKLLKNYLLSGVGVVMMVTMAFAISSLARSSALAIGISLFAFLSGNLLVVLLQGMGFDWARYLLFSNLDLASIAAGTSTFAHQSLLAAIVIDVLHFVVFLLTAWDGFVRREV